ncbi:MAG TPA: heavy-metal-associated domain-containing protein [Sphingorhabdus lacus]|jgi:hypothetical protein|nr:heavy-metal-associated domain-containing protein [Sphingorhabdus lacus]HPV68649.1 heavy-metal-associated domain-containing protein [Sphingorhabdus lacus]
MLKMGGKWFRIAAIGLPLALIGGGIVVAQIEGPKRGIAPIASSGDFEVTGVAVNISGKNAFDARQKGWEEAQRLAWAALWRKTHGGAGSTLSDSTLDGIVAAIVVENEQIGPRRYVAKLSVLFDRARAGQLLGVSGVTIKSAPLLLLPVTYSAGAPTVFEQRTSWQRSWAKFRTAESRIDYVRPSGAGGESLLLNAGQMDRRSRIWWRTILDQFGAADVIIPIARIERQWPGGPVIGRFSARYGPDNKFLGSFTLKTSSSAGIPAMMDQAVVRMDQLFQSALSAGTLRADASLVLEPEVVEEEELETEEEVPLEGVVDPNIEAPAVQSLEDVVRSIAPEPAPQREPAAPAPAQPPRP